MPYVAPLQQHAHTIGGGRCPVDEGEGGEEGNEKEQVDEVEARRTEHPDATAAPRDGICAAAAEWGTGRVRATEAPRMFEQHRSLIGR